MRPPHIHFISGGGRGIRTPESLHPNGFQDRRHRPLGHPSAGYLSPHDRMRVYHYAHSVSKDGTQALRRSADFFHPAPVGPEDFRPDDRAVWRLVILQHGDDDPRQGEARTVEGVHEFGPGARLGAEADVGAARLEVHEVAARANLQPLLNARRPDLNIVPVSYT